MVGDADEKCGKCKFSGAVENRRLWIDSRHAYSARPEPLVRNVLGTGVTGACGPESEFGNNLGGGLSEFRLRHDADEILAGKGQMRRVVDRISVAGETR